MSGGDPLRVGENFERAFQDGDIFGLVDAPMTENRPFRKSRSECFSRSCAGPETWTRHTDDEMPLVPMRDARQRHDLAQSQPRELRRGRPMLSAASRIPDCTLRKAIFVYLHACLFPHAPYPSLDMLLRHGLRPDNLLQMWSGTDRDKPNRLYRRATCNLGRGRIAITRTDGRHVRYRGKIRITLHHL